MNVSGGDHGRGQAAVFLLLGQLAAAGAAFLVNILASWAMPPGSRGLLAFVLQVAYILTILSLMGLERPFMANQSGTFFSAYRQFIWLAAPGFSVVLVVIGFAMGFGGALGASWLLIAGGATFVATNMLVRSARVAYVVSRDWKPFLSSNIGSQVIIVLGAIVLALSDRTTADVWILIYCASGVIPLALLVRSFYAGSKTKDHIAREARARLRRSGVKLLPAALGNTAMVRSDRLLLPVLGSPADLGVYVTVATVMEMAVWPLQQWVDVSLRSWSVAESGARKRILRTTLVGAGISAGIAGVLALAAWAVVVVVLPISYRGSLAVIIPLGVASVIYSVTRIQQGFLIAMNAPGIASLVEMSGWIAAIVGYFALIPNYGILGGAYGSIIGYSVCAIAGVVLAQRSAARL